MTRECVLYERECIGCGECDICDLDEDKICDNCGKCLEEEGEFRTLDILKYLKDKEKEEEKK